MQSTESTLPQKTAGIALSLSQIYRICLKLESEHYISLHHFSDYACFLTMFLIRQPCLQIQSCRASPRIRGVYKACFVELVYSETTMSTRTVWKTRGVVAAPHRACSIRPNQSCIRKWFRMLDLV